jgi:hypothetical protein
MAMDYLGVNNFEMCHQLLKSIEKLLVSQPSPDTD